MKAYIKTFGCQMNEHDTERMYDILVNLGYAHAPNETEADLIILNSCSVRDKSEHKVFSHIGSLKELKEKNPNLLIGVGGCVAEQEGSQILQRMKHVDFVFGTHNIDKLEELVSNAQRGYSSTSITGFRNDFKFLSNYNYRTPKISEFITITSGCNKYCTFCIVPYVRGKEISRDFQEILNVCRELVSKGTREIHLIGQNVNSYTYQENRKKYVFADLLRAIADIDGVDRIRFTTSHPRDLTDALIDCFRTEEKLASHLHLPVQCGSNRVLKKMIRNYTKETYVEKVARLREARSDIALTSDIIVGFPTETEEEFEETLDLIREIKYYDLFSFIYSKRKGTRAAAIEETYTQAQKFNRLYRLHGIQNEITTTLHKEYEGKRFDVLVEGFSKKDDKKYEGRTSTNKVVHFFSDASLKGKTVPVRITKAQKHFLEGEVICQ